MKRRCRRVDLAVLSNLKHVLMSSKRNIPAGLSQLRVTSSGFPQERKPFDRGDATVQSTHCANESTWTLPTISQPSDLVPKDGGSRVGGGG